MAGFCLGFATIKRNAIFEFPFYTPNHKQMVLSLIWHSMNRTNMSDFFSDKNNRHLIFIRQYTEGYNVKTAEICASHLNKLNNFAYILYCG